MPLTSALYNPFPEEITVEPAVRHENYASQLMGGGRARLWSLQRTGRRGRPSFAGLEELLSRKLAVGQELVLDAPTAEDLEQYIKEARKAARRHGVALRFEDPERIVVAERVDPKLSWSTEREYRFRSYITIMARRSGTGWMAFADHPTSVR